MVPYESGARRITSNLGSDLFCPLWLVGLAHLEWRARVARSCCIGRRWSVGCSPLVLDRSSWSVVGSFLKFGRNSTCCQYGGGNVLPLPGSSLSQLFGVDHLSSRSPLHRLGEGQGRGGKRLPRAALLPHCDRCLTGASALDFGHPHGEWHQGFPRLGPKRRQEVLWRISARSLPRLWPESALCRLHFGRPLGHNQGVQRVSTKTKECASALPVTFGGDSPRWASLASLSPVMSLTPTVVDLGWFMSSGCKNCSWRREPSRHSILGNILHVMRRSGGGRMESPTVSQ